MVEGWNPPSSGPDPSFSALGWSAKMGSQITSHISSIIPSSSMSIPTNAFIMENPPLSSSVSSRGSHFYSMGNPQHRFNSSGGNVYNPYHVSSTSMVPLQPIMNQLGVGYYPIR
jgi:hypothetical protein